MRAWRLSRFESQKQTFDGEGARLYPGRWNHEGVSIVYASEHLSLAALELLVHLEPSHLHHTYYSFSVDIEDNLLEALPVKALPPHWDAPEIPTRTRDLGSEWARSVRSLGLIVPSVPIPSERNILLNPLHPHFPQLRISKPLPFRFDGRLA